MGKPDEQLVTFRAATISAHYLEGSGRNVRYKLYAPDWLAELFCLRSSTIGAWRHQLEQTEFPVPHVPVILGDQKMTLSEAQAAYAAYEALPIATRLLLEPAMEALAAQLAERGVL